MKHSIIYFVLLVIISIFTFSIYSCNKENPTTSNNPGIVDSNIFEWHVDTIHEIPMGDFYVADSNNIFIPGNQKSVYIKNGTVNYIDHNDNNFGCNCVNGSNINNVFFGGTAKSTFRPLLKKWNGSGLIDINVPIDSNTYIANILALSDNDIWMTTPRTSIDCFVIHFLNGSFFYSHLEHTSTGGLLFMDNFGVLYMLSGKPATNNYEYVYVLKYENDTWNKITSDSVSNTSEIGGYIGFSGDKILRGGNSGIYYFTGNSWDRYISVGDNIVPKYIAAGDSPQNIMFIGRLNDQQNYIFYFDGKTIYKLPYPTTDNINYTYMKYKSGIFYLATFDADNLNYFVTARLRK